MKQYLTTDSWAPGITAQDVTFLCGEILANRIFVVVNQQGTQFKVLGRNSESYTYNYTYYFLKLGFARKVRNSTSQDKAAINSCYYETNICKMIYRFVLEAIEDGLFSTEVKAHELYEKINPQFIAF